MTPRIEARARAAVAALVARVAARLREVTRVVVSEEGGAALAGSGPVSAREALQAAVVVAVRGSVSVAVFDAPPLRGALPHVLVEEAVLTDWSTKDWRGHEARFALLVRDTGERPVRVRSLLTQAADAVLAMAPALDGWRVATLRRTRERVVRAGDGWTGAAEFVVRLYREDQ